ncbi:uncharacterized protein znf518a [Polymixia lowei]
MDSVDICATISTGDNKQVVSNKSRDWHKRLRLRKTAVQPLTMQGQDKHGPKKIAEEWGQNTNWPSSKKSSRKVLPQHRKNNGANILRFRCSQCKDNLEFVPKDLVRHFEETHRGSPPVFPCHMCTFSTHEFSYLQVHLLSHKDTFSSCNICNDNVQRTLSEFSIHLTTHHSQNGKYSCETCNKFSTGDVGVFLEHMYLHSLALEKGSEIDLSAHTKKDFQKQLGFKTTTRAFHCQYCGYEAPQKRLITKHMNAVHGGQNGNHGNQNMKEVHPITVKPNDAVPKRKHRLTRNTVRQMRWLSQDCLSLPGREFLGKYCSLSDPGRTLEETQQFLVRSTAGETGGQKWTKALQTVLSNVPQDINLHPKLENGIMSNSSKDLTVLTVKNKITVPQIGATYAKRLKRMASSEKAETVPSESAAVETHCVSDSNRCQSSLNDQAHCPGTQITLNNESSVSGQNEPAECSQIQENRENRELGDDGDIEEHRKKYEETISVDPSEEGIEASKGLKLSVERDDQTSISKALPKNRGRKGRRKRRTRAKTIDKGSPGLGLRIVLKKNPVKNKQWMSQSPLLPPGAGLLDDHRNLPYPQTTLEETQQFLQRALSAENSQKECIKTCKTEQHNTSEAIEPTSQSNSVEEFLPKSCEDLGTSSKDVSALMVKNEISVTPDCTTKPTEFKVVEGKKVLVPKVMPSTNQEIRDETERAVQLIETEVDNGSAALKTSQSNSEYLSTTSTNGCCQNVQFKISGDSYGASRGNDSSMDCHMSDRVNQRSSVVDDATHGNAGAKSSSVVQLLITPEGKTPSEALDPAVSSLEQSDLSAEVKRKRELSKDHCPELPSKADRPSSQTIQQESSRGTVCRWQPAPRNLERTLKLISLSPTQLIKRPFGDQPVVVLNHPDADIPEVTNIMEIVHRYKGEVQKVVLSRKTLKALLAMDGEFLGENDRRSAPNSSPRRKCLGKSVQERFLLKLRLRRMSRKKYQVVSAVSDSSDLVRFRCWFCGRAFSNQETWIGHRQRHLMEWKGPNCEES